MKEKRFVLSKDLLCWYLRFPSYSINPGRFPICNYLGRYSHFSAKFHTFASNIVIIPQSLEANFGKILYFKIKGHILHWHFPYKSVPIFLSPFPLPHAMIYDYRKEQFLSPNNSSFKYLFKCNTTLYLTLYIILTYIPCHIQL